MSTEEPLIEADFQGGCKWMTTYEHALLTDSTKARDQITCCNCGLKVPYVESWVTVAFGQHGNRLPLPTFLHCRSCSLILDPQVAYRRAYGSDPLASLPDPVKLKREEELNQWWIEKEAEPD